MSLKIDRVQLEITVGNDQARKKLRELDEAVKANTRELKKLERANKTNTDEYRALEQATKQLRIEQDKQLDSIGLVNLSTKEISARSRELRAILQNLSPSSDTYKKLNEQLVAVDGRLASLRNRAVDSRTAMQRLADTFNRYQAIGATMTAFFAAMVYGAGQFISSMSEMADLISNVAKNTDLTTAQVREMKKEFETFNTRSSSKDLLEIAAQAGKLGVSSKKEILEFTKEANEVVVSFGKDLGGSAEDTINTLGKVIGAYRLNTVMSWGDAIKYIGSVVNELGKQGTASEASIVEYLNRLSSAGVGLKVSADNIAAIGATLDGLKINAERGATATSKFMFSLVSKSKEMSAFLGVSEAKYKKMVEKDLLGTMMQILNVAKSGNNGLFDLVQQMDAMDVSGTYMTETVMALTNNIDVLQDNLKIANEEMKTGQSIMKEYEEVNNNFAGRIAIANKEIIGFVYSLQQKLEPVLLFLIEGFASFLKFIERNITVFSAITKAAVVATTAFFSYSASVKLIDLWTKRATASLILDTIAKKAQTIGTIALMAAHSLLNASWRLMTGNIKGATISMREFNSVTKLNPIGFLLSALTMAIGAWVAYSETVEDTTEAHEDLKSSFASERAEMQLLFAQLKMYKSGTQQRSEAIAELNSKYGKYLPYLIDEKTSLAEINIAQKEAIENIQKRMMLEIAMADIKATMTDEYNAEKKMNEAREKYLIAKQNAENTAKGAGNLNRNEWQAAGDIADQADKTKIAYGQAIVDLEKLQKRREALLTSLNKKLLPDLPTAKDVNSGFQAENLEQTGKAATEAGLSIWELIDKQKKLSAEFKTANFGSARWKELRDDIESTKKAIEDFGISVKNGKITMPTLQRSTVDTISESQQISGLENKPVADKESAYILKKYNETIAGRKALVQLEYSSGLISHAEFLDKKKALDDEYEENSHRAKMEKINAYWGSAQKLMAGYSEYQNSLMNTELEAAGNNETKKDAIKRKYAKKEQNMAIVSALINQSIGITEIWSKWASNPVVATTLSAIELVATGLQIAAIKSKQYYTGRYDVTGASDNRTYRNVPFLGNARTGIVRNTALVAERGSEGIVDHNTLYAKTRDHLGMTAMDHFKAISAIRYTNNTVPQYAEGRYLQPQQATAGNTNYATRDEIQQYVAMQLAYMQKVDDWQRTLEVRNDPRQTLEKYDNYKTIENRARG